MRAVRCDWKRATEDVGVVGVLMVFRGRCREVGGWSREKNVGTRRVLILDDLVGLLLLTFWILLKEDGSWE